MYGKLPDNITLKNIVILMTCAKMVINILSITILEEALLLIYTFDEKIVKKILVSINELNINFKRLKKDHVSIYIK